MNPYLVNVVEFGPIVIERIFARMPMERYDEQTAPGRFTPREAVAHLADWEPIFLQRMRDMRDNPGCEIVGQDEGERAKQQKYHEWNVVEALGMLADRRARTAEFLRSLAPNEWELHGMHSDRGRVTIFGEANMLLGHDLYHIEHLSQLL